MILYVLKLLFWTSMTCYEIGAMLGKMMSAPEKFCQRFLNT